MPERWEKISAVVGSRSKAECVARCKVSGLSAAASTGGGCGLCFVLQELVARVRAKKQQS